MRLFLPCLSHVSPMSLPCLSHVSPSEGRRWLFASKMLRRRRNPSLSREEVARELVISHSNNNIEADFGDYSAKRRNKFGDSSCFLLNKFGEDW